jgi:hypothetical protein
MLNGVSLRGNIAGQGARADPWPFFNASLIVTYLLERTS